MTPIKTRNKIIFRANGNPEIGFGHLYRCLALAQMIEEDYQIQFLLSKQSTSEIIPSKYSCEVMVGIDINEEPNYIASKYQTEENFIVLDGYKFKKDYCVKLKDLGFRIIYIDDFGRFDYPVNHIINHAIGLENSKKHSDSKAILHLGSKMAMLRPEFLKKYPSQAKRNVLISFGGSDIHQLSAKAIKACLKSKMFDEIHVIQGHLIAEDVQEITKSNNNVIVHQGLNAEDMVELMLECKLALCSASNFLYELCSLRIPSLVGYYVDNQINLYNGALSCNIIIGMGDIKNFTSDDFYNALESSREVDLDKLISNQEKHFDHKSDSRIKDVVKQLSLDLHFKPASEQDIDVVFEWANDPLVRQNSYYSTEISYEVHTNWFHQKLASPSTIMLLMYINDKPAGFARFESEEDHAVIGILINSDFRGQKLASPMLKQACEYFHSQSDLPIWAYIKKTNIASHKSFIRANFEYLRDDEVNKEPSVVLSLYK